MQRMRRTVLGRGNSSGVDITERCDGRASALGARVLWKVYPKLAEAPGRLPAAAAFRWIGSQATADWFLNRRPVQDFLGLAFHERLHID